MPEDKLKRWYWILEEKTKQPILRGGQLSNLNHNQFLIEDIESPDIKAEVIGVFEKHPKSPPTIEYKKIRKSGRGTAEKIVVIGISTGRD